MSETVIRINNVSKVYKLYDKTADRFKEALSPRHKSYHSDHFALDGISMEIKKGECVGIIGTNGSGKSTLLKIVTGVLSPSDGNVEVNGKISALLELGTGFNPEYTGIENIYLNGTMVGFTREEMDAKVNDIVEFAELGDFINQPVKTYSSGMFARLAFAVAINVEPDILIVDEALSVGDIFFQSKCYRKFNDFKEKGKTILFVSHDMGSVLKYCDRSLLIHKGKQIAIGKSSEVIDIYKKILVNQYDEDGADGSENLYEDNLAIGETQDDVEGCLWKNKMILNPNFQDYGDGTATIVDFGMFDENNQLATAVHKGSKCKLRMKIHFNRDVINPIFAFTIKDLKGTDITGTNTMLEENNLSEAKAGQEVVVEFEQYLNIQGGQYLISLGCTGYEVDKFEVYHRLYDVFNLEVFSSKNTIGFFDTNSKVNYLKR